MSEQTQILETKTQGEEHPRLASNGSKPTLIKNSSNYLPSMTPVFPDEQETMSRNPSRVTSPKTESSVFKSKYLNINKVAHVPSQPHILIGDKHTARAQEAEQASPEEQTMCRQQKFI